MDQKEWEAWTANTGRQLATRNYVEVKIEERKEKEKRDEEERREQAAIIWQRRWRLILQRRTQRPHPEETPSEETNPEESTPEEIHPEEIHPEEIHPEEIHPEETNLEETNPEETYPEESHPEETHPEETQKGEKISFAEGQIMRPETESREQLAQTLARRSYISQHKKPPFFSPNVKKFFKKMLGRGGPSAGRAGTKGGDMRGGAEMDKRQQKDTIAKREADERRAEEKREQEEASVSRAEVEVLRPGSGDKELVASPPHNVDPDK